MLTQDQLRQALLDMERTVLGVLARGNLENTAPHLHAATLTIQQEVVLQRKHGTLDIATQQLGARVAHRLEELTGMLRKHRTEIHRVCSGARDELDTILVHAIRAAADMPSRTPTPLERPPDALLNATYMRDYFLRNLGYPFPTRQDRDEILAQTNANITRDAPPLLYNQVILWFINTRRRSGWTTFLRKYAHGDKARLVQLAWALECDQGGTHEERHWSAGSTASESASRAAGRQRGKSEKQLSLSWVCGNLTPAALEQMRDEWAGVVERIRVGSKDRIGDWMDEVIRTPSTTPRPTKKRRRA
ncbi:hypothetical protein MSPP1_000468 [Malassezia sp. CBS 17886]|nr:hypothetical protein MSPP1_000468 [Malassezia sp. CBS 17886]